ncbi:MAG: DUF2752 domain-containing protein [Saccharofermentans sp.]|nr:DUF2752 domain-containing protein [Saccharofermentans sp.]
MNTTWKKTIRDILIAICIGIAYFIIIQITGHGLPCTFLKLTGLPCPSCGITRMFISLSRLDFKSAYQFNQFLFFTWPLFALECVYVIYKIEDHKDLPKWNIICITVFGIALLCFGTLRNLYLL